MTKSSKAVARLTSVGFVAALLALWEAVIRAHWIQFDTIPTPSGAVRAWLDILGQGQLSGPLRHTLWIFALSFGLAASVGILLGIIIGLSRVGYTYLHGTLEFLRFVPPPALIPLMLIIAGFTDQSEIMIAAFASLWPVLLNTADGAHLINPQLREVGRSMCLTRRQMVVKLVLPAALPMIAVGLRLALSMCLIMVVTTEIVAIRQGLGFSLASASSALRSAEVYAYLLTVGGLGLALNVGFRLLEKHVLLRGWSQV